MKDKAEKKPDAASLREYASLFPYLAKYRWQYIWGLVCLVVVDAAQMIIPQFLRRAIDLISSGDFQLRGIIILAAWMAGAMAIIAGGRFLWRYFIHGSSRRIETELREKLFSHLQTLSWDFYQKNKTGDLMARSINDLNAVRMAIGMGFVAFVDFVVMATSILIIIFVQDARSALYATLPLPLVTVLILIFGGRVGLKFRHAHETYSAMSDTVQETFAGLRVVKSFVKEWWFIKKFADTNDDYLKANMELARLFGFFFPLVTFLSEFTILIMLVAGGIRVVNGMMSPGSLVAMFRYLQMLIWPLMGAGFMVNMIQRGAVSLSRVNEVLNTVPSIRDDEINEDLTQRRRGAESDEKPANDVQPTVLPEREGENESSEYLSRRHGGTENGAKPESNVQPTALLEKKNEKEIFEDYSRGVEGDEKSASDSQPSAPPCLCENKSAEILFAPSRLCVRKDSENFSSDVPVLEVRNLNFAYIPDKPVLKNICFSLKQGEWLGIMGHTGSGKSTLVKTFTRMVDPPEMSVFVQGRDAREWSLRDLRSFFAVSPQDSYLFSDSIKNNIGYGFDIEELNKTEDLNKIIGQEELDQIMQSAAARASLEKDMAAFNRGWETTIGERGLTLSGGQKQRVAIARALIMGSEILILDDSLSAVDAETEQRILKGVLQERKQNGGGKTTIIVSHRVSSLRYCDYVLVLDRGAVCEYGNSTELEAAGGYYSRMAELQRLESAEKSTTSP
jgi:ABC-type multidrug transport system fused ATPase/permease subunit